MIDYLNLTAARLWEVFAAGVPNWTGRIRPGNALKRLLSDLSASYKQQTGRAVVDFPALDIAPTQIGLGGFGPNRGATNTFALTGSQPGIAPLLSDDGVAWELRITTNKDDYYTLGTLWPLMSAAVYRSGAQFSLKPWSTANAGPLTWVRTWQGKDGAVRPEKTPEGQDVLVARPQIVVRYIFDQTQLYS
jgi:hypothetical protein